MSKRSLLVDSDIRRAHTLPGAFYSDEAIYASSRSRIFARAWQAIPDVALPTGRAVAPFTLLPGFLDEPLLLTRDEAGREHALSNVCTHRGNLLVDEAGEAAHIRCRYHGRRFGLDGNCVFMPEFKDVRGFPGALMLNFYPWGLSLNVVLPEAIDRTRVQFRTYVFDPSRHGRGAGGDLDRVEVEDEAVVEAVARGTRSRFYDRGRFSPTMERGVHQFHRMLANELNEENDHA